MNLVGLISQGNYRFIVRILPNKVTYHVMEQDLCIDEEFEWSYDDLAETSNSSLSLTKNMHSGQYVFSGTDAEWIQVIKNLYKYYETCTNFVLGRSFAFENQAKVNFSYDQVIEQLLLKKYNDFKDDDDDYSDDSESGDGSGSGNDSDDESSDDSDDCLESGNDSDSDDAEEEEDEEESPKSKGKEILMEIFKAFLTGYRKKKEDQEKTESDHESGSESGDDSADDHESGSESEDNAEGESGSESGDDDHESGSDSDDDSKSESADNSCNNDPSKWKWSRDKAVDRIYEFFEKYIPSWVSTIPALSGQQDLFANSTKVLIGKMSDDDLLLVEMSILDDKIGIKGLVSLIKEKIKINCSPEMKSFLDLLA